MRARIERENLISNVKQFQNTETRLPTVFAPIRNTQYAALEAAQRRMHLVDLLVVNWHKDLEFRLFSAGQPEVERVDLARARIEWERVCGQLENALDELFVHIQGKGVDSCPVSDHDVVHYARGHVLICAEADLQIASGALSIVLQEVPSQLDDLRIWLNRVQIVAFATSLQSLQRWLGRMGAASLPGLPEATEAGNADFDVIDGELKELSEDFVGDISQTRVHAGAGGLRESGDLRIEVADSRVRVGVRGSCIRLEHFSDGVVALRLGGAVRTCECTYS
ncbi:hypothetical protein B0H14DRAFT_2601334 [Mycena olivaceomarginata]|nr:hypothetical protein B0H14DRAFT_2601334 [Mycena olivaceomarginata]